MSCEIVFAVSNNTATHLQEYRPFISLLSSQAQAWRLEPFEDDERKVRKQRFVVVVNTEQKQRLMQEIVELSKQFCRIHFSN